MCYWLIERWLTWKEKWNWEKKTTKPLFIVTYRFIISFILNHNNADIFFPAIRNRKFSFFFLSLILIHIITIIIIITVNHLVLFSSHCIVYDFYFLCPSSFSFILIIIIIINVMIEKKSLAILEQQQ